MGSYVFTFHVVSILPGVKIGAYVDYHTTSIEMIHPVESQHSSASASVSSPAFLTQGKLSQAHHLAFEVERAQI